MKVYRGEVLLGPAHKTGAIEKVRMFAWLKDGMLHILDKDDIGNVWKVVLDPDVAEALSRFMDERPVAQY
jgi:hypothetical protein